MDNGPLFHRNGAGLWPHSVTSIIIGVVGLICFAELILGIVSVAS